MKPHTFLPLLLSFSVLFQAVHTDRILVLSFFSTKSHKITYMRLIEELADRGHQITILSPITPMKEIKNVKEIFTFEVEKLTEDTLNVFDMKKSGKTIDPVLMIKLIAKVCEMSYELPHVMEIMNGEFDLVFMQPMFNECALGIVHRLNLPLVLFSPTSVSGFLVNKIGGDFPLAFTPNPFMGYSDEMTFYQRIINFGINLLAESVMRILHDPYVTSIYREKLGQDIPSIREILSNHTSLILSNGHFGLSKPRPYLPDVVDVGGIHSRPAKPLPKDLEEFVTKSGKDGFILFSMGSAIKGDQMPEETRKMFLRVFSKLKQQVLWKWESESMPDLPKNVKLSKWLPQQDLLGHPNIKMFITHCGGGSTEEAIYHAVPLLGIPMMADQPTNAKNAKVNGFIVILEWNDLTENQLSDGINEVLNNPIYRNNVQRLSKIFKDQPDDPLKRGAYWVEYVLRHKGAPHLRSASRKLNFFQYYSLDVIAVYASVLLGLIYIIVSIIKFIFRKLCGSKKEVQSLKIKKNQ